MKTPEELLVWAAGQGNTPKVRQILAQGADVNATDQFGKTALMHAARAGHAQTASALVEAGADVNARSASGETALAKFAERGATEIALALIDKGADAAAGLRGTEEEAKVLAKLYAVVGRPTLFAAGAFAPEADRLADCCRAAMKGIAGVAGNAQKEEKALQAALDALWP